MTSEDKGFFDNAWEEKTESYNRPAPVGGTGFNKRYYYYDKIIGTDGDDVIMGNSTSSDGDVSAYSETIEGGDGNDIIIGRDGDDTLDGGEGDDWIFSGRLGEGSGDTLIGGGGADTFVLGSIDAPPASGGLDWSSWAVEHIVTLSEIGAKKIIPNYLAAKAVTTVVMDVVGTIIDATQDGSFPEPPQGAYDEVMDFNPLEDVIIIPVNDSGKTNIFLSLDFNGENAFTLRPTTANRLTSLPPSTGRRLRTSSARK